MERRPSSSRRCSVGDCEENLHRGGYCATHFTQYVVVKSSDPPIPTRSSSDQTPDDAEGGPSLVQDGGKDPKAVKGGGLSGFFLRSVRSVVSQNKRRYTENGYDLDLTYITNRVIAMGFPSEKIEGWYRNPLPEVYRFLEEYHHDHYKVFNLCSERSYDHAKFHGRVEHWPFDDHQSPPLAMMLPFCTSVNAWLDTHPENIVAIHCKAGKGRTGVMICSWMLSVGMWDKPDDALRFFAVSRTEDQKGVTLSSQQRYVNYMSWMLRHGQPPSPAYHITIVRMNTIPNLGGEIPWFHIKTLEWDVNNPSKPPAANIVCDAKDLSDKVVYKKEQTGDQFDYVDYGCRSARVQGDVGFQFFEEKALSKKGGKLFYFWFNTGFVSNCYLKLTRKEMDKCEKNPKVFTKDFNLELFFVPAKSDEDEDDGSEAEVATATVGGNSGEAGPAGDGDVDAKEDGVGVSDEKEDGVGVSDEKEDGVGVSDEKEDGVGVSDEKEDGVGVSDETEKVEPKSATPGNGHEGDGDTQNGPESEANAVTSEKVTADAAGGGDGTEAATTK